MKKVFVLANRYMDSVTLMGASLALENREDVLSANMGMGTRQNMDLLREEGFVLPEGITRNDLMIALECAAQQDLDTAYAAAVDALNGGKGAHRQVYHDVDDLEEGSFDLVQISLPGPYALKEAYKAIDKGMDVFMFTADVSLEEERALKIYGRDRRCLVMGPDAGVGLLGGVALAAGSIVRPGPIGVIGASGSGSQEVACLIEDMGYGVTCILGTGGRDLKKAVGGVSMKADMARLEADPDTRVICLVSMLADREVMEEVLTLADRMTKPVAAVFLGADESLYKGHKAVGCYSLREAAAASVRLLTGSDIPCGLTDDEITALAVKCAEKLGRDKKYFRGLYTGGTFAEEALMVFRQQAPQVDIRTNRDNTRYARRLQTHKISEGHTLLDMGDLDFTAEAPHTVFDPAQRLARFRQELSDPQVGVIAMDIILGPGVAPDPAGCYLQDMQDRPDVVFVCAVCGGEGDPQNKQKIKEALKAHGAVVVGSNDESARLCAKICRLMEEKNDE